jgi:hypothetical protein
MMLNPIALKSSRAAIIHVHWQGHCDGALRIHQPVTIVLVDAEVIGNDLKLVTCHSKHVVVVNTHELSAFEYGAKMEVCYLSRTDGGVKSKRAVVCAVLSAWVLGIMQRKSAGDSGRYSASSTTAFATRSVRLKNQP